MQYKREETSRFFFSCLASYFVRKRKRTGLLARKFLTKCIVGLRRNLHTLCHFSRGTARFQIAYVILYEQRCLAACSSDNRKLDLPSIYCSKLFVTANKSIP